MLVTYSVSFDPFTDPAPMLGQLRLSLWSLREQDPHVPVAVFAHGPHPDELGRVARAHRVELVDRGGYAERLAALCPEGWPVLARYPTLHKFLNHDVLAGVDRVLACDCDTLFRAPVGRLLDAYATADVYAREEVHSARSRYGPEPEFLDEAALARVAASLGVEHVPPFNTGVVVVNHGRSAELALVERWFVQCVWQLVVWMARHPDRTNRRRFAPLDGIDEVWGLASPEQRRRALPYPSANPWIVEEVATWLALGALPGLTTGHFSPADVPQNGEVAEPGPDQPDWLVAHYFSTDPSTALAWLSAGQRATT